MQVAQHHPVPSRQEHTTNQWQNEPMYSRTTTTATPMSNQVYQPLAFSIDDHLSQQHLTQLDLCSKNLKKIEKLPNNINFNVVLLDYNDITKVEHLDVLTHLIQLSISHNRLIDIRLISRLKTLQKLNLSNNSLDSIDCLKTLQNLVILNISGNNIHNIGALNNCHSLQALHASDNSIQHIEDLSHLTSLKYLNLHKNLIDTLTSISKYWPKSIHTLIISDNELKDLTEICYLSSLIDLNTLYIHNNPCLFVIDDRHGCHQPFDYRPYILNWCLTIHNLDGIFITRKESLKSEWLLSQGKGRSFRSGEHNDLVQYLIKVCGTNAEERDDLHLSRIMIQQDLYKPNVDETLMRTSNTMKDANDTLSKDSQLKLQKSLLISESEFVKLSSSSSISTNNEPIICDHQKISFSNSEQQMQTPSPRYIRTTNHNDEQIIEHNSKNRYNNYDNRPIKPLDKNMLQSKLNQYPIENHSNDDINISRPRATTNPQQSKRTSTQLTYNANRYSPKTTTRGPIVSTAMHVNIRTKSNKNLPTQQHNQAKRHTIAADNTNTIHLLNRTHRTTSTLKNKNKQQPTLNENKNLTDDEDELQLKSAPVNTILSTQNTTYNRENSIELKKLTTPIETIRTSVLQAYLDLHERFTKTTELQTSALAVLWKMFDTQNSTHQRETEKILEENRLLNQRLHELELRLNIKSRTLYPPLRVHISKRDTKSFFLHWIPNPLNEQHSILGYRIYIDNILKNSIQPGKFETIIDYIYDEGEYKIKLRTYDEYNESEDSNIIVARFRRQQPITLQSDSNSSEIKIIHRIQSDPIMNNTSQIQLQENLDSSSTNEIHSSIIINKQPDKTTKTSEELISPVKSSPSHSNYDNIINRKPPKSPSTSPNRIDKTTTNESCNKILFTNNSDDISSTTTTKHSPIGTGIMSRLSKSPHRIKRNVLLNALTINQTPSPIETVDTNQSEIKLVDRTINSQVELHNGSNHDHFLAQQLIIPSNSTNISSSTSPLSPIPPQNKNILLNSLDHNSF
ncbi:unnamed protein product [Rotaria sordida]|uniref:Centrosomal protein of 97 kDa n=1 Tax=Rotaria sordida TaxID=392033 RepID=A0A814HKC6_9BILA|nr:unnamed protein product [Rotaria sordida]